MSFRVEMRTVSWALIRGRERGSEREIGSALNCG
jgi:hypothetical protein